jgi:hypothetical protein
MGFDSKKLRKSMMTGRGSILIPHIETYQRAAKFPETWNIQIRNRKDPDGFFHPSGDCFTPPSQLYKQLKGQLIYIKPSPALRRTFDVGHFWHGYLQAMLLEMGFVTKENIERHIEHKITTKRGFCVGSGTADLVDVEIPGHGKWLVDIKSMNKPEFEAGVNEFTMRKWQAQVSCYMDWLGADKAFILAVSKDSPHAMHEYQVIKDVALLDEIYDRWSYVAQCMRTQTEPDDENYKVNPLLLNPGDSVLDVEIANEYDKKVNR